ncbi:MAG: ATP-dependent DNA helicase RecG [Firmicutes bacterium]|nr:ATP-dependent DNA helicase RecG [Bacillota bacterium]
MDGLKVPVSAVRGIGEKKQKLFEAAGIKSVEDLLHYFPRDYEDRTKIHCLKQLPSNEKVWIRAMVTGTASTRYIKRNFSVTKLQIEDTSGKGWAVWFNNPFTAKGLRRGVVYDFFGKAVVKFGETQVQNPNVCETAKQDDNYKKNIVPIYSKSGKLSTGDFERAIYNAMGIAEGKFDEIFPHRVREEYNLEEKNVAIRNIHFPADYKSIERSRHRLAFEELFLLQLSLFLIKSGYQREGAGIKLCASDKETEFLSRLPFTLTGAQLRVWHEIKGDMESNKSMNRLLQGDVGSGKTVLAALAMVKAAANGYQGALMVPTEILAEQHYITLNSMMKDHGIKVELLTGSCSAGEKREKYRKIQQGEVDIIIGTHALIQEKLEYRNLGIVVTDEQHRFGVRQRAALLNKGKNPEVLVMTATPIPRTLALILHGDMDISVIDQMPPGRKEVKTYVIEDSLRQRAYDFVAKQVKEGRQGYIVCPLIEDSESIEAASAAEIYDSLAAGHFKDLRVSLLHGKMSSNEKECIMKGFRDGKIDLLVSTTVIEVGVNVPNANIMLVENAERFGLAQLHQLRGRVGRGNYQSYCILINGNRGSTAVERMRILASSSDGFAISEKDLELRGPGDFLGTRQHGIPELKIAQLPRDINILKQVQRLAEEFMDEKAGFSDQERALVMEKSKLFLSENNFPGSTI